MNRMLLHMLGAVALSCLLGLSFAYVTAPPYVFPTDAYVCREGSEYTRQAVEETLGRVERRKADAKSDALRLLRRHGCDRRGSVDCTDRVLTRAEGYADRYQSYKRTAAICRARLSDPNAEFGPWSR